MPRGFHARKHAAGKEYSYRLSRAAVLSPLDAPFVASGPPRVDLDRMAAAAATSPAGTTFRRSPWPAARHGQPFRSIFAAGWEEQGEELRFPITGDGFLRGMVRALVGTLIEVGIGRRIPEELRRAPRRPAARRGRPHRPGPWAWCWRRVLLPSGMVDALEPLVL